MCGIAGIISNRIIDDFRIDAMLTIQHHRGPDFTGVWKNGTEHLGHNRLSIIDLHEASHQPFWSEDKRYCIVFNGEIYNYIEIRREIENRFHWRTKGDTEVLLNSFILWGTDCLQKLKGMFSFAIWDTEKKELFAARDRFGVKPFHYYLDAKSETIIFASEIKSLFASGLVQKNHSLEAWSNYLTFAQYASPSTTFYDSIYQLPASHFLIFKNGNIHIQKYYFFENSILNLRDRDWNWQEQLKTRLLDSIELRLRADVNRGFNLSGGIDSTLLFVLIQEKLESSKTKAFTFYSDDKNYDELEWVSEILNGTEYNWEKCLIRAESIPEYAKKIQFHQDEPYAGIATLAYARTFEEARKNGYIVILDGSGMDEQIAGYDYYTASTDSLIQGSLNSSPIRTNVLNKGLSALAKKAIYEKPFATEIENLQYRDIFYTKLPRDLRMTDRISMAFSTEMREPFMDHELMELSFAIPMELKIKGEQKKVIIRKIIEEYHQGKITEAPKRPVQTPQREWLSGDLKSWVYDMVLFGAKKTNFFNQEELEKELKLFFNQDNSNSFYIWQWISVAMIYE